MGAGSLLLYQQQARVHLEPAGRWPKEGTPAAGEPVPDGPGQRAALEERPRRPLCPERILV